MMKNSTFITNRNTENAIILSKEAHAFYDGKNVDFISSYIAEDGENEWVDPTTSRIVFETILEHIPVKKDKKFLDVGSGLGHVVYLASSYYQTYGVEIIKDVYERSIKNLKELGVEKRVHLYNMDFLELPSKVIDNIDIFFLSSPVFESKQFGKFVQKIVDSIHNTDREVYIIYYYPYCSAIFDNYLDCFQLKERISTLGDIHIYYHKCLTKPA